MFYSRIKETPRCLKDHFIPLKGIRMTARRTQSTTRLVSRHRKTASPTNQRFLTTEKQRNFARARVLQQVVSIAIAISRPTRNP